MKRNIWGQSLISLKVRWYEQASQAWDCFLWFTFVLYSYLRKRAVPSLALYTMMVVLEQNKRIFGIFCCPLIFTSWFQCPTSIYLTKHPFKLQKQNLKIYRLPFSAILLFLLWLNGLEEVSFHSNPKEKQCQRMLKIPHNCTQLTR